MFFLLLFATSFYYFSNIKYLLLLIIYQPKFYYSASKSGLQFTLLICLYLMFLIYLLSESVKYNRDEWFEGLTKRFTVNTSSLFSLFGKKELYQFWTIILIERLQCESTFEIIHLNSLFIPKQEQKTKLFKLISRSIDCYFHSTKRKKKSVCKFIIIISLILSWCLIKSNEFAFKPNTNSKIKNSMSNYYWTFVNGWGRLVRYCCNLCFAF